MKQLLRDGLVVFAIYAGTLIVAAVLFLALTRSGLFAPIHILFYRGIVELAVVAVLLMSILLIVRRAAGLQAALPARDAIAASVTATAILLAAFTLGPVTVDRSVSIFMLGRFALADHPLGSSEVEDALITTYIREWEQIPRRLDEQVASGNLERTPEGYRLTPQGMNFIATARRMAETFDTDRRFVGLPEPGGVVSKTSAPARAP